MELLVLGAGVFWLIVVCFVLDRLGTVVFTLKRMLYELQVSSHELKAINVRLSQAPPPAPEYQPVEQSADQISG